MKIYILKYCKIRKYVLAVSEFIRKLQDPQELEEENKKHQLQQEIDQELPNIFSALTTDLKLNTLNFTIALLRDLNLEEEM